MLDHLVLLLTALRQASCDALTGAGHAARLPQLCHIRRTREVTGRHLASRAPEWATSGVSMGAYISNLTVLWVVGGWGLVLLGCWGAFRAEFQVAGAGVDVCGYGGFVGGSACAAGRGVGSVL